MSSQKLLYTKLQYIYIYNFPPDNLTEGRLLGTDTGSYILFSPLWCTSIKFLEWLPVLVFYCCIRISHERDCLRKSTSLLSYFLWLRKPGVIKLDPFSGSQKSSMKCWVGRRLSRSTWRGIDLGLQSSVPWVIGTRTWVSWRLLVEATVSVQRLPPAPHLWAPRHMLPWESGSQVISYITSSHHHIYTGTYICHLFPILG